MPNHITTEITGPLELADLLTRTHTETERLAHEAHEAERKQHLAERGMVDRYTYLPLDMTEVIIDFAMLVPQPENIETGGCTGEHPEGVVCWYDWNITNWGTKWNGYHLELEHGDETVTLRFETAWAHPFPIVEALSKKAPDSELSVYYADEDLGHNLGSYTISDGEPTSTTDVVEGTRRALDFAARLQYGRSYAELTAEWDDEG